MIPQVSWAQRLVLREKLGNANLDSNKKCTSTELRFRNPWISCQNSPFFCPKHAEKGIFI